MKLFSFRAVSITLGTLLVSASLFVFVVQDVYADLGGPGLSYAFLTDANTHASYSMPYFPITLSPGSTVTLSFDGELIDPDGGSDITQAEVTFYRSGVSGGSTCSVNDRDCYRATCSLGTVVDIMRDFTCQIAITSSADATDEASEFSEEYWRGSIALLDASNNGGSYDLYIGVDINSLLAAEFPNIVFGTIPVATATDTSTNSSQTIVQKGNTQADVAVSGEGMVCAGGGTIPVSDVKWSLTDVGFSDGATTSLSASPTSTSLTVPYIGGASTQLFWNVQTPSAASGVCSGTIQFDISPSV